MKSLLFSFLNAYSSIYTIFRNAQHLKGFRVPRFSHPQKSLFLLACAGLFFFPAIAKAEECKLEDRACVLTAMEKEAANIEERAWRDQVYREIAKTLAFEGNIDGALAVVDKIETPDTKALTIRGIGMAAADTKLSGEAYTATFTKLRASADKISDPPSHAIALTYIAMAQAFAGDNDGAWKTASEMENEALRHKAYAETAEIQAERGDYAAAEKSINFIGSAAFRNKAFATIAKILADHEKLQEAYQAAQKIDNSYKKVEALQYVLDEQKPREVTHK
jgi:hypothetical protein